LTRAAGHTHDDVERLHEQGKGFRTQILASPPEGKHGSGWTLVTAPEPEGCKDSCYDDYKVKPHIHHTASILLVVNGTGLLSIQRGGRLIQKKVCKGTVVLFPAEVPHTFKVLSQNFQVASGKSEYRSYGNSEFELPLPFSPDLTSVSFDEYEQTLGL
jgi:mannose-6-phosphate isomerase-like protein (cupin superfamily)